MRLLLTVEAQNCTESGMSEILRETIDKLHFLTNKYSDLENKDNYGTEFREIAIIPSCMDDEFWTATGWKERKQIWRKKREADIRLRMDYDRFMSGSLDERRLLFYDIIIKSIEVIKARSKGDFLADKLIKDILFALNVSEHELKQI